MSVMSSHYVCGQAGIVEGDFECIPRTGQKVAFAWERVPALGAFQYVKWVAGNFDASKHSLIVRACGSQIARGQSRVH
jgi:hypothetical protein